METTEKGEVRCELKMEKAVSLNSLLRLRSNLARSYSDLDYSAVRTLPWPVRGLCPECVVRRCPLGGQFIHVCMCNTRKHVIS